MFINSITYWNGKQHNYVHAQVRLTHNLRLGSMCVTGLTWTHAKQYPLYWSVSQWGEHLTNKSLGWLKATHLMRYWMYTVSFDLLILTYCPYQCLSGRLSSTGSLGSNTMKGTIQTEATTHSINRAQIFTTIAEYQGQIVAVKKCSRRKIHPDRQFLLHMKNVSLAWKYSNVCP